MPTYTVNASVTFAAWVDVEADSPEAAVEEAKGYSASSFEYDDSTGDIDFNVTPEVEPYAFGGSDA